MLDDQLFYSYPLTKNNCEGTRVKLHLNLAFHLQNLISRTSDSCIQTTSCFVGEKKSSHKEELERR